MSPSITREEFIPHPFAVAQAMQTLSYVSFETALGFHRWIPEAVHTTASVTPKTKSIVHNHSMLGRLSFTPLAIEKTHYLESVVRHKIRQHVTLIASPLRALMDLVEKRKQKWEGIGWIEEGLRIEDEDFLTLRRRDFASLKGVYKHLSTKNFLKNFEIAVFEVKQRYRTSRRAQELQSND